MLRRGYTVYKQVCAACHSMRYLAYRLNKRNLAYSCKLTVKSGFLNPPQSELGNLSRLTLETHLTFFCFRNLVDVTHTEDEAKALAEEDQVGSNKFQWF